MCWLHYVLRLLLIHFSFATVTLLLQLRDLIQSLPSGPARSPVLSEASKQHAEGRYAEAQAPPVTEGIEDTPPLPPSVGWMLHVASSRITNSCQLSSFLCCRTWLRTAVYTECGERA